MQVLVEVALAVLSREVEAADAVDDFHQHGRRGDFKHRITHVFRVGRVAVRMQPLDKREHTLPHDIVDGLRRAQLAEMAPAVVIMSRKDTLIRQAEHDRVRLLRRLHVVELLDKEQIRELLDDLQWIRNPARPKDLPDAVHLITFLTLQHTCPPFFYNLFFRKTLFLDHATPVLAEMALTRARMACQSGTLPWNSFWICVPRNGSCWMLAGVISTKPFFTI